MRAPAALALLALSGCVTYEPLYQPRPAYLPPPYPIAPRGYDGVPLTLPQPRAEPASPYGPLPAEPTPERFMPEPLPPELSARPEPPEAPPPRPDQADTRDPAPQDPVTDLLLTPLPQRDAARAPAAATPKPPPPADPLMGFRPMRGQTAPAP